MSAQVEVQLVWKTDKLGNKYLWGASNLPGNVDLSKIMFFIWPNPEDSDEPPVLALRKREDRRYHSQEAELEASYEEDE